jgi:dienelactone hydrolase
MFRNQLPLMKFFFFFLFGVHCILVSSQEKVTFYTTDSLKVTADLYLNDYHLPFIVLLHQAESSRGEYVSIAPRLKSMGYNCLAVDLRAGGKSNYIKNETAIRAREMNLPSKFSDAQKDIDAALRFIKKFNRKPVILFGSSYSASLALLTAVDSDNVMAVVAFSPGEYLRPEMKVKPAITGLHIPVFLTSADMEYDYMIDLTSEIESKYKTIYKPGKGNSVHGAKALWADNPDSKECWFQLSYFFGKLNNL